MFTVRWRQACPDGMDNIWSSEAVAAGYLSGIDCCIEQTPRLACTQPLRLRPGRGACDVHDLDPLLGGYA